MPDRAKPTAPDVQAVLDILMRLKLAPAPADGSEQQGPDRITVAREIAALRSERSPVPQDNLLLAKLKGYKHLLDIKRGFDPPTPTPDEAELLRLLLSEPATSKSKDDSARIISEPAAWSTETPSEPGWYWQRWPGGDACMVQVIDRGWGPLKGGLVIFDPEQHESSTQATLLVKERGYEWLGPLTPPTGGRELRMYRGQLPPRRRTPHENNTREGEGGQMEGQCPNCGVAITPEAFQAKPEPEAGEAALALAAKQRTAVPRELTFDRFQAANVRRCEEAFKHRLEDWTLLEWAGAAAGEMGEAANVAKKLRRLDLGSDGAEWSKRDGDAATLRAELADEIGDVLAYLSMLAAAAGLSLARCGAHKFDRVSAKVGWTGAALSEPSPVPGNMRGFDEWWKQYRSSLGLRSPGAREAATAAWILRVVDKRTEAALVYMMNNSSEYVDGKWAAPIDVAFLEALRDIALLDSSEEGIIDRAQEIAEAALARDMPANGGLRAT